MKKMIVSCGVLLGAVILLAGCAPAANGPTGVTSPVAKSAPSATPRSHASATGPVNVCEAVPLASVAQTTGRSVYSTMAGGTGSDQGAAVYYCQYSDGDISTAQSVFTISVYRGGDATSIMSKLAQALGGVSTVSGVGDSAQANDVELDTVYGSDVVVVSDTLDPGDATPLPRSDFVTLSKQVQKSL